MRKNKQKTIQLVKANRRRRIKAKIFGTSDCPRFVVSKSLNHIYLQLVDDNEGKTLVAFHTKSLMKKDKKTAEAFAAGQELALLARAKKITKCIFDRGTSPYHGRVKAAAEGARAGGLKF